jgi:hypothetical protein
METESTRSTVGCQLVADVLRMSGKAQIRVFGSSMLPRILPGDIVIVHREVSARLAAGDVALVARNSRLFAHRVVTRELRDGVAALLTRGDSLSHYDAPVFPDELLGRVTSIRRGSRQLDPRATLFTRWVSSALGNSQLLKTCLLWLLCRIRSSREVGECPT